MIDDVVKINFKKSDMLGNKSDKDAEAILFSYNDLNKVLCSTDMLKGIPSYLGQRSKRQNIELVRTTLVILLQNLLTMNEVSVIMDCFKA